MFKKYLNLIITVGFVFFSLPLLAGAELDLESLLKNASPETFFIELVPETPGPSQNVYARINGFSFDIDRAEVVWNHNGKVAAKGLGLREYRFQAGKLGGRENLRVEALANGGQKYSASLSFVVSDIDFLWRAATSRPDWYQGKTLPSLRSNVIVTAFPHLMSGGREIAGSELIYRWSLDGDFKQKSSGAGKQNFSFQTRPASDVEHAVELQVSNLNGNIAAQKTVIIPVKDTLVLFYEEHPLEGPRMNFALDPFSPFAILSGEAKMFKAEPFFFSLIPGQSDLKLGLNYNWTVDGQPTEKTAPFNILNLSAAAGAQGLVSVDLLIKHAVNILQQARAGFQINVQ
ncbi:MAG: hypothetical protein AAB474_00160 [Patescibacteria group bacterium]